MRTHISSFGPALYITHLFADDAGEPLESILEVIQVPRLTPTKNSHLLESSWSAIRR